MAILYEIKMNINIHQTIGKTYFSTKCRGGSCTRPRGRAV